MLTLGLLLTLAAAAPVNVQMTPANPTAAAALKDKRVAAALAARMRLQTALVAGDSGALGEGITPDAIVNSPHNNIATAAETVRRSRAGIITHKYLRTSIEYAGPRRQDEVVFMGEEIYEPAAEAMHAGKTVRRRFTDVYQKIRGRWLLSLRQATIVSVD